MTSHRGLSTRTAGAPTTLLGAYGVSRTFGEGDTAVQALREVSVEVPRGQLLVVRGRSGSGKTTLLNCLGGLETPDAGHVLLGGDDLATMSSEQLVQMRRHRIGYVFQSFGLLPILSAAENVGVPMRLAGAPAAQRDARKPELLIADEPTGQLDSGTGRAVMDLLRRLVHEQQITAVVATHDPVLLGLADRVVELSDGAVVADSADAAGHGRHRSRA